jgi:hypothetical protein
MVSKAPLSVSTRDVAIGRELRKRSALWVKEVGIVK